MFGFINSQSKLTTIKKQNKKNSQSRSTWGKCFSSCHASDEASWLQSVSTSLWSKLYFTSCCTGLKFVRIFTVFRGWTLLTLMIQWTLIEFHQQVSHFTLLTSQPATLLLMYLVSFINHPAERQCYKNPLVLKRLFSAINLLDSPNPKLTNTLVHLLNLFWLYFLFHSTKKHQRGNLLDIEIIQKDIIKLAKMISTNHPQRYIERKLQWLRPIASLPGGTTNTTLKKISGCLSAKCYTS